MALGRVVSGQIGRGIGSGREWRFAPGTQLRRKKQFKKRLKARLATLQAQQAGEQPVASLEEAAAMFQKRTGKR